MYSGLGTDQNVHTPAASDPIADGRVLQRIENLEHVDPEHVAILLTDS
jgi:hypothetical protein